MRNGQGQGTVKQQEYWAAYDALPPAIRQLVQQAELNLNPVVVLALVRKGIRPTVIRDAMADVCTRKCLEVYGPQHPRAQQHQRVY